MINLPFDIRPGSKVLFEFCKIYGHFQADGWLKTKIKKKTVLTAIRHTSNRASIFPAIASKTIVPSRILSPAVRERCYSSMPMEKKKVLIRIST